MDELKNKRRISFVIDAVIFIIAFFLSYVLLKSILPYHFEMGPGNINVIEYNIITPFAGSLIIIFLVRLLSLLALNSSLGMKLNKLQFNKKGFPLLKYDIGIYLLILSLVLFSLHRNFEAHCCGLVDPLINPIELYLPLILFGMIIVSIVLWIILFQKRNKSIQILLKR